MSSDEILKMQKIEAEIAKLMAETSKLNKELRWYKILFIIVMILIFLYLFKIILE